MGPTLFQDYAVLGRRFCGHKLPEQINTYYLKSKYANGNSQLMPIQKANLSIVS